MKSNNDLKRNDFWKIECLDCGVNADLLTDTWKRIICRECLNKHEFSEVENEIYADSDIKEESVGNRYVLHGSDFSNSNHRDSINEKPNEIHDPVCFKGISITTLPAEYLNNIESLSALPSVRVDVTREYLESIFPADEKGTSK